MRVSWNGTWADVGASEYHVLSRPCIAKVDSLVPWFGSHLNQ